MARIRFSRGTNAVAVDVPAEREWLAAVAGQAGTARISLPRDSVAASPLYIDPDGGSPVRIYAEDGCGDWAGIILPITYDGRAVELTAVQTWAILGRRVITIPRALRNVTAGFAGTVILQAALAGVPGLHLGEALSEIGTHLTEFDVSGDAWGGLTALMDVSDTDVHIDAQTGEVNLCGPVAYAPRYDTLLIAGANLRNVTYRVDPTDRVAEVYASDGETTIAARRGDIAASGWPAQAAVSAESRAQLASAARLELERRSKPSITISGSVGPEHWDIRERMFPAVVVPWARFTGAVNRCRVLGRSISDFGAEREMNLRLQVIDGVYGGDLAVGGAARQKPPERPGADPSRPSGSIVQNQRRVQRRVGQSQMGRRRDRP